MLITQVKSPNFTPGRTQAVKEIVIHWIVGTLASADAQFKTPASQVSAHYGIESLSIHQYVKESDTAWHAKQANPFTIGIEHSAAPGRPASSATYSSSIALCADICKRYGLDPMKAIVPHSKYVATECPGTMDLSKIKAGVQDKLKEEDMKTTRAEAIYLWRTIRFKHSPTDAEIKSWTGRELTELLTAIYASDWFKKNKEAWQGYPAKVAEVEDLKKQVADGNPKATALVNAIKEIVKE